MVLIMEFTTSEWIGIIAIIVAIIGIIVGTVISMKKASDKNIDLNVNQSSGAFSKSKQKQSIKIDNSND